jgi:hypothetical protein
MISNADGFGPSATTWVVFDENNVCNKGAKKARLRVLKIKENIVVII